MFNCSLINSWFQFKSKIKHANSLKVKRTTSNETKAYGTSIKKKKQFRVVYMYKVTIEKKDEINEYKKKYTKKKGKDKKKSVPVPPLPLIMEYLC